MSWEAAFVISLIGTAFLFVYISTLIGTREDKVERPVLNLFYTGFKIFLIASAMFLTIIAISSNLALWRANDVNINETTGTTPTNLEIYHSQAYRVSLWTTVFFFSLFGIIAIADYFYVAMKRGAL